MFSVTVIFLSGLVFAACHSLLASQRIKNRIYATGISPQRYRLYYVISALVLSIVWLSFIHRLPDHPLYMLQNNLRWIAYLLQAAALYFFWLSLKPIDVSAFLGLK